jgi:hypothetical protein
VRRRDESVEAEGGDEVETLRTPVVGAKRAALDLEGLDRSLDRVLEERIDRLCVDGPLAVGLDGPEPAEVPIQVRLDVDELLLVLDGQRHLPLQVVTGTLEILVGRSLVPSRAAHAPSRSTMT